MERNRRDRWSLTLGAVVLGLVCPLLGLASAASMRAYVGIFEVHVTNVHDTAFTVSWVTSGDAPGEIHYGTDAGHLDQTAFDQRGAGVADDTHYVVVDGLSAETRYYFDVVSGVAVDDNGGAHYTVTTGRALGPPPSPDYVSGQVWQDGDKTPAEGSIIYITLQDADGLGSPGSAATLSSLVDASGGWSANLSSARISDLSAAFDYSPSADELTLTAEGGADGTAAQTVSTADDSPAPDMALMLENPPQADFAGAPTAGTAPLAVDFSDESTGAYQDVLWSFGDGATATLASPTHTYTALGPYTVTLTLQGPRGSDTLTRSSYITACYRTDVACNCGIDVGDVQMVAEDWRCADGDGCYRAAHDFDVDGVITVVDIMVVAGRWGCTCGDACYEAEP